MRSKERSGRRCLSANVNYELAGANEWRHEPSLEALEEQTPALLPRGLAGRRASCAGRGETRGADVPHRDPSIFGIAPTLDGGPRRSSFSGRLQPRDGALFVTEPFDEPVDLAGRLRGELDFTINKYDVDLVVMLYELRSDGEYVKLFEPGLCLPRELRSGPRPPSPAHGRRKAAAAVSERADGRPQARRPAAGW